MRAMYSVEWDKQFQCECTGITEGLCLIAEAEKNGEILGYWAGIRAMNGNGIVADVKFHPPIPLSL